MAEPFVQVHLHIVWATWDRLPLLDDRVRPRVHGAIAARARDLGCRPIVVGGVADHVHALVALRPAVPIAKLVQEIKGHSSYLMTHEIMRGVFFKWQGSYGVHAVELESIPRIRAYILDQPRHHLDQSLHANLELTESARPPNGGRTP